MLKMGKQRIIVILGLLSLLSMSTLWFNEYFQYFKCSKKNMAPNPEFADFQSVNKSKKVDLLIIVLSASPNFRQRSLIRQTWWKSCKKSPKVACWFFTDKLESIENNETRKTLLTEQREYDDIIISPVGRGIQFGLRLLHLMRWGKANYDFKYILRIDDDIMLCLDHLLWDLPNFPLTKLHYGWLACYMKDLIFIDDATTMYSSDVVDTFLSQKPDEILCHPFADQQVMIWENALGLNTSLYYLDNDRIHQQPPASHVKSLKQKQDLCDNYISIHGIYRSEMLDFWKRRGQGKYTKFTKKTIKDFCQYEPIFNDKGLDPLYRHKPKPCHLQQQWNLAAYKKYPGREDYWKNTYI